MNLKFWEWALKICVYKIAKWFCILLAKAWELSRQRAWLLINFSEVGGRQQQGCCTGAGETGARQGWAHQEAGLGGCMPEGSCICTSFAFHPPGPCAPMSCGTALTKHVLKHKMKNFRAATAESQLARLGTGWPHYRSPMRPALSQGPDALEKVTLAAPFVFGICFLFGKDQTYRMSFYWIICGLTVWSSILLKQLLSCFIKSRAFFRIKGSKIWNFSCSLWCIKMHFLTDTEEHLDILNLKLWDKKAQTLYALRKCRYSEFHWKGGNWILHLH